LAAALLQHKTEGYIQWRTIETGVRLLIISLHLSLTELITDNSSNNIMIRVLLLHITTLIHADQILFFSYSNMLPLVLFV